MISVLSVHPRIYMFNKTQKTKEPENADKAYEYAVFLLSLKLRTVGEMLKKMQDRGYTEQVIERVLGQLKDQRYINDERYAEIFLENLKAYRSFGFFGIKKKMLEKKLPQALIDSTLAAGLSVAEEMKIAQRLLKKEGYTGKTSAENSEEVTYRTYEENSENKAKQKMANKLKTRGFRSEVISRLMF